MRFLQQVYVPEDYLVRLSSQTSSNSFAEQRMESENIALGLRDFADLKEFSQVHKSANFKLE